MTFTNQHLKVPTSAIEADHTAVGARRVSKQGGVSTASSGSHERQMATESRAPITMVGNNARGEHTRMLVQRDPEENADRGTGPATRFLRCSGPEQEMIRGHLGHAVNWVQASISKLDRFFTGRMSREGIIKIIQAYLINFDPARLRSGGTWSASERRQMGRNLRHIMGKLEEILQGLQRNLLYVCLENCPQHRMAQVQVSDESETGGLILPPNAIEMCSGWFRCSDYYSRVTTLIHEVVHSELLLLGDIYEWSSSYYNMEWDRSKSNADSYSVFIRQVYHLNRSDMGPGRTCDS